MTKRQNHQHLLRVSAETVAKGLAPRPVALLAALLLAIPFALAFEAGLLDGLLARMASPGAGPTLMGVAFLSVLAIGLGRAYVARSAARKGYLRALQSPAADPLVARVNRMSRALARLPDGDAVLAHERAVAYALYGGGPDAFQALAEVAWGGRAPMIRAMGLGAEALVEALCRRDPARALELARRAQEMATVSPRLPGAARSASYYRTCVGLAEVLLGQESRAMVESLEETAADPRSLFTQLIAAHALALARERAGDAVRAAELRDYLRRTAPHCAPLHAELSSLVGRPATPREPDGAGPVESAQAGPAQPRSSPWRRIAGGWVALVALYLVMRWLLGGG